MVAANASAAGEHDVRESLAIIEESLRASVDKILAVVDESLCAAIDKILVAVHAVRVLGARRPRPGTYLAVSCEHDVHDMEDPVRVGEA